jgi:hypothetical protein
MGVVKTNRLSLAYAIEQSLGVLPGSPTWKLLEPNDITTWGANTTKVARDPISPDRQRRKGTTTDLDSTVEFEHDLTREVFLDFIEGFCFASVRYPLSGGTTRVGIVASGSSFQDLRSVDSTNSFDHDTITTAMSAGQLIYVRGFTGSAMNGLHEVDSGSSATSTVVTVGSAITDETPGDTDNATMVIAGFRAATSDLVWTNATKTLSSTILDFTDLGLSVGQVIHIGGLTTATQFSAGVAYARISSIAANAMVFDKVSGTLAGDDPGTGDTVDLLFGGFLRNVTVTDSDFLERSFQFELAMPNLGSGGATRWQYAIGNYGNQVTFQLPLADKAIVEFGFVGTDTENPTDTQATGASTPVETVQTTAFNTSADIARLRVQQVDETGLTTCFKNVSLTLNNQVTPEKCLGTLGATELNTGTWLVDVETQILLTNEDVISAIKDNETVTFDFIIKNDDGAIAVDIPSMTLGGGDLELPRNESVRANMTGEAFRDATLGYTAAFSLIPTVP